jgi:hypothetical protein
MKLLIATVVYIIILFMIAPIIDHSFTPLDKTESNTQIMFEIISQIIVISLVWYIISEYIIVNINNHLGVTGSKLLTKVREVISAVIMVGLQKNLIAKLEYISLKHPIRFIG